MIKILVAPVDQKFEAIKSRVLWRRTLIVVMMSNVLLSWLKDVNEDFDKGYDIFMPIAATDLGLLNQGILLLK